MIKILFFANLRDQLDCETESLPYSQQFHNIQGLINFLSERGEVWEKHLNNPCIKVAVNQEMANVGTIISDTDEIAFFPPVTGG